MRFEKEVFSAVSPVRSDTVGDDVMEAYQRQQPHTHLPAFNALQSHTKVCQLTQLEVAETRGGDFQRILPVLHGCEQNLGSGSFDVNEGEDAVR